MYGPQFIRVVVDYTAGDYRVRSSSTLAMLSTLYLSVFFATVLTFAFRYALVGRGFHNNWQRRHDDTLQY